MKKDLQRDQPLKVLLSFLAGCKLLLFLGLANKGWQIYGAAFDIPFVRQAAAATGRMDADSILSRLDDGLKGGFALL